MPTPTERRLGQAGGHLLLAVLLALLTTAFAGCGGEPSQRELRNARAFEALLTAVSLKNRAEFDRDAELIEERHASGDISEENYGQIKEIIEKGRAKDWAGAEKRAYEFRSQFGDRGSFFN